jgi:methanethiol S-methyltransferase
MTAARPARLLFAWTGALLFTAALALFLYAYFVRFGRPAPAGAGAAGAIADVALFTVFALHHSALARTGIRARVARLVPAGLERSIYVWTASLLFIGVCVLWQPVPGELYRLDGAWALAGYAVQALGVALTACGAAAIGMLDLAGVQAAREGAGAPPAAPAALATSGLYGVVRHPLYLSWVLVVFGTPHMTMTRFVFAATSTAYLAAAIPLEERTLAAQFGDAYLRYRARVRWRMIPFLY